MAAAAPLLSRAALAGALTLQFPLGAVWDVPGRCRAWYRGAGGVSGEPGAPARPRSIVIPSRRLELWVSSVQRPGVLRKTVRSVTRRAPRDTLSGGTIGPPGEHQEGPRTGLRAWPGRCSRVGHGPGLQVGPRLGDPRVGLGVEACTRGGLLRGQARWALGFSGRGSNLLVVSAPSLLSHPLLTTSPVRGVGWFSLELMSPPLARLEIRWPLSFWLL